MSAVKVFHTPETPVIDLQQQLYWTYKPGAGTYPAAKVAFSVWLGSVIPVPIGVVTADEKGRANLERSPGSIIYSAKRGGEEEEEEMEEERYG